MSQRALEAARKEIANRTLDWSLNVNSLVEARILKLSSANRITITSGFCYPIFNDIEIERLCRNGYDKVRFQPYGVTMYQRLEWLIVEYYEDESEGL